MSPHEVSEAYRRGELRADLDGVVLPVQGYFVTAEGAVGVELHIGADTLFVELGLRDRLLAREGE